MGLTSHSSTLLQAWPSLAQHSLQILLPLTGLVGSAVSTLQQACC
jgi:hypothetical protein